MKVFRVVFSRFCIVFPRSYGNPPLMVTNVMCAVCVLLKEPTSWPSVKHIMSDPVAFLKRLTDLHKDEIHDNVSFL